MAKRTRHSSYHDRYANHRLELSDDGILFMQCHTNGGSLVWDWRAHNQMSDAFADIAGDREIKVLIHTGAGENYNANWGRMPNGDRVETPDYLLMPGARDLYKLDEKSWYARHLITKVLDVDVPMISAVNGPCNMHSEVPLLGDIVLASEEAYFQDASHFPRGQVPGDGQHVIWSFLAGHTRARYFLLTGMKLGAAEAKQWGVVNEVLAKDKLLDRGQRYEARLSKPYDDLVLFYDAAAPRAEAAIAYLNGLDINELPPDAERLLQLLYSMILISHAVNVFKQNRIPDSGAAFFDMVAEPAV